MLRRVALLRGINVGGRTVRSEALRGIFEEAGLAEAEPFLASGNVGFRAAASTDGAALEATIEKALRDGLRYDVPTFVRSCAELAQVADAVPLASSELAGVPDIRVTVIFLKEPAPRDLLTVVAPLRGPDDDFVGQGRELYWLRRGNTSASAAWTPLERALTGRGTMRTLGTVQRLVRKFCA